MEKAALPHSGCPSSRGSDQGWMTIGPVVAPPTGLQECPDASQCHTSAVGYLGQVTEAAACTLQLNRCGLMLVDLLGSLYTCIAQRPEHWHLQARMIRCSLAMQQTSASLQVP